jgi:hypothetical protein
MMPSEFWAAAYRDGLLTGGGVRLWVWCAGRACGWGQADGVNGRGVEKKIPRLLLTFLHCLAAGVRSSLASM